MKLSNKKIVEKKFETVINGYSPTQVDMFLDKICLDYMEYDKRIADLELELENLRNENVALTENLINLQNGITNENETEYQADNDGEYQDDNQLEFNEENPATNNYEDYAEYNMEEVEEENEEETSNK
ncbi:MAG: DivIVA domain-containing protein [Metamycoplasmataceae bacterium]